MFLSRTGLRQKHIDGTKTLDIKNVADNSVFCPGPPVGSEIGPTPLQ